MPLHLGFNLKDDLSPEQSSCLPSPDEVEPTRNRLSSSELWQNPKFCQETGLLTATKRTF